MIVPVIGVALIAVTIADIYFTVLYARPGAGVLSPRLSQAVWAAFRWVGCCLLPDARSRVLSHSGPALLVLIVAVWVTLLTASFAMIYWPAVGTSILSRSGSTSVQFATALYYSGYALTTLGVGDVVAVTAGYRLLTIVEAALGFSVLTLTLTYVLSVYGALSQRNVLALRLQHRTSSTGDAAELLALSGRDTGAARGELSSLADGLLNLIEAYRSYPVLHYFRPTQPVNALPRIAFQVMDLVTLVQTALDPAEYRSLIRSTAVTALREGGNQLLKEIPGEFGSASPLAKPGSPAGFPSPDPLDPYQVEKWRRRFHRAAKRLQAAGIATAPDLTLACEQYIRLRQEWQPYVEALAMRTLFEWQEIAPADEHPEGRQPRSEVLRAA